MKQIFSFLLVTLLFTPTAFAATQINGAGATFPFPLYSKWFDVYHQQKPEVFVNYSSIGSGGGITALLENTVDFGASDAPMNEEEMKRAKVPVLHVPTVLGAVVISYNLPGLSTALKFSGDVLANIYLGKITKWNDPKIVALNPGVKLPDTAILVVYRSDGSGTTSIFTDYLSKVSAEWKKDVGAGKSVSWPTGLSGKGNEGVAGLLKQTPGAIGYLELVYAAHSKLPVAEIENKSGVFIAPSVAAVTAAAAAALKSMPKDFRVSITDASGKASYPISSFTYLLIPSKMKKEKGQLVLDLARWVVGPQAQKLAEPLHYAPLPQSLVGKVLTQLKTVRLE
jgi:phosphate transport system substrate-binding protein